MNAHCERGLLLFRQQRYKDAVQELQQATAETNDDSFAHGLLALCLSGLDRHQPALEAARRAIELAPDSDYGHYALARVLTDRSRLSEACDAINTAIQLSPDDADNHGLLARIEFERGNWDSALRAADAGLECDGDSDLCLHYRSLALVKLGRTAEAERDQQTLLAANPDDPHTHAARGWTLLEQGEVARAREHFLESLRLEPRNEDARLGLANAFKAQHFVFGWVLRLLLYLGRFRSWVLWIGALGFFVGLRQLDRVEKAYPDATVALLLVKAAFWFLIVLITIAEPLFGLIIRLDKAGARSLTPDQTKASNWHAVCLIAALGMGLLWSWKGGLLLRVLALATLLLTSAITHTFQSTPGWARNHMKRVTLTAALLIPLSYLCLIVFLVLLVKFKVHAGWIARLGLIYLPLSSILLSAFSDNIAEYLEQRRPDPA